MEKMQEHLMSRPMASIYLSSDEKNNKVALKLMCVIDFLVQKSRLNDEIDSVPNLRHQLLQLSSFESFGYYEYLGSCDCLQLEVYKCKLCGLFGSYLLILTHLALTHDMHIGMKKCLKCKRSEINRNMSQEYHDLYLVRMEHTMTYPRVVAKFYDMLRSIGIALKVKVNRYATFDGSYKGAAGDSDRFLPDQTQINIIDLNRLFDMAMEYFNHEKTPELYSPMLVKRKANAYIAPYQIQTSTGKPRRSVSQTSNDRPNRPMVNSRISISNIHAIFKNSLDIL